MLIFGETSIMKKKLIRFVKMIVATLLLPVFLVSGLALLLAIGVLTILVWWLMSIYGFFFFLVGILYLT